MDESRQERYAVEGDWAASAHRKKGCGPESRALLARSPIRKNGQNQREDFVREESERDPAPAGIEQSPEQGDALEPAGPDPGPAVEFRGDARGGLLPRDGLAVVNDGAARTELGQQRDDEVVDDGVGGNRDIEIAADRIDRRRWPPARPPAAPRIASERSRTSSKGCPRYCRCPARSGSTVRTTAPTHGSWNHRTRRRAA